MALQLRALVALVEDLGSVPSTYTVGVNYLHKTLVPENLTSLLASSGTKCTWCRHTHAGKYTHTHTHKNKNNKKQYTF